MEGSNDATSCTHVRTVDDSLRTAGTLGSTVRHAVESRLLSLLQKSHIDVIRVGRHLKGDRP